MGDMGECSWSSSVSCCIGSIAVLYYLLRWSCQCWHGFRVYVMSEIWQTDLKAYGQWAAFMNNWRTIGVLDNRQVIQQGPPLAGQMSVVKQPGGKYSFYSELPEPNAYKLQSALKQLHCVKVVTGATSGIGRAYAEELAKRGLDLVLISRSEEKLHRVAKDIESQFRRQTRVIQADFTEGHSIYSAITQQLEGLEIGILVNNVGMNYTGILANFLDVPDPEQRITQVINCNILSVTQMSRLILPGMVERGKGLIINMSSEAASQPQPMLSLYSATKIFVTYFSRCLSAEYRSHGITVQCVAPFVVSTNMTHNVPVNPLVKSAASFARDALNTVGYTSYTSGCVTHALQNIALSILFPDWLRLSSFCVQRMAKLALNTEPQIRERMANNKQD